MTTYRYCMQKSIRPDYNEMLSLLYGLISKYQVDKIYIHGANPSFIKSLKQIDEDADYDKVIARYRVEGLGDATKEFQEGTKQCYDIEK